MNPELPGLLRHAVPRMPPQALPALDASALRLLLVVDCQV
jgi:hypothetical protein